MAHYRKFVDTTFFRQWSSPMAYVLGYFAADGSMYVNSHGAKYVDFVSTDRLLLEHVKGFLQSEHRITQRRRNSRPSHWKPIYRLQIGGGELYRDLERLGFTPNKDASLHFPTVPNEYLASFVRGYFDGDGGVGFGWCQKPDRESLSLYVQLYFAAGNLGFLRQLDHSLHETARIHPGYLRKRSIGCYLYYQRRQDLKRFYEFLYPPELPSVFYLSRKKQKFQQALDLLGV